MDIPQSVKIPEPMLVILNQLFQIEQKSLKLTEQNSLQRNIDRIKEELKALGYIIENPVGQKYDETRIDCEANIAGDSTENLVITEVLKPIIRVSQNGISRIGQRAVVIVQDSSKANI
jgi:hypothetical protein